jgi:hypothetical protein
MFVRVKNINGQKYAYLVKNRWLKKGTRQKVSKYLGKVVDPPKQDIEDFYEEIALLKPKEILRKLIEHELLRHGFEQERLRFKLNNIEVDLYELEVKLLKGKGKPATIKMNGEFLSTYSLRKLFAFKSEGDQDAVGLLLAQRLVQTGLKVDREIFIELFGKVYVENGVSCIK